MDCYKTDIRSFCVYFSILKQEFSHPYLLLENHDGYFSKMVRQTGTTSAAKLSSIAETAFLLSPEFSVKPHDPSILSSIREFTHL